MVLGYTGHSQPFDTVIRFNSFDTLVLESCFPAVCHNYCHRWLTEFLIWRFRFLIWRFRFRTQKSVCGTVVTMFCHITPSLSLSLSLSPWFVCICGRYFANIDIPWIAVLRLQRLMSPLLKIQSYQRSPLFKAGVSQICVCVCVCVCVCGVCMCLWILIA